MSIHPSLKSKGKLKGKRSVLKRSERIQWMMEKKVWDDKRAVFGLPKIKIMKLKAAKKEKKEEKKEDATTPTATTATPTAAATPKTKTA